MDVIPVPRIEGTLLFRPSPHIDDRGFFCRTFDAEVLRAVGLDPAAFIQHSQSRSVRGVVRGLHIRRGDGEAKLRQKKPRSSICGLGLNNRAPSMRGTGMTSTSPPSQRQRQC